MRDTRTELLMQAEILVRGRGWSGFSYADLAAAVGIRKASIHHHFPTKTDLGAALVAAYGRRYAAALASIRAASEDGLARIEAYGRLYLGGVEQDLGCLCAALATEGDRLPDALRADVAAFFADHLRWLEAILSEGQAGGGIRPDLDATAGARYVVASLEGALLMERLIGSPAGFEDTLALMIGGLRRQDASTAANRA